LAAASVLPMDFRVLCQPAIGQLWPSSTIANVGSLVGRTPKEVKNLFVQWEDCWKTVDVIEETGSQKFANDVHSFFCSSSAAVAASQSASIPSSPPFITKGPTASTNRQLADCFSLHLVVVL
jgi:hypothetical protein